MNHYNLAPLISFIFLLVGGFYVIKKGNGRVFNWLFALAIFSLAAIELGNFMVLTSASSAGALFWQRWVIVSAAFLSLAWVVFSLIFARELSAIIEKMALVFSVNFVHYFRIPVLSST